MAGCTVLILPWRTSGYSELWLPHSCYCQTDLQIYLINLSLSCQSHKSASPSVKLQQNPWNLDLKGPGTLALAELPGQNHIMAHLFEWPWEDIANECLWWDDQYSGTQQWMVYNGTMEHPNLKWMKTRGTPILGNLQLPMKVSCSRHPLSVDQGLYKIPSTVSSRNPEVWDISGSCRLQCGADLTAHWTCHWRFLVDTLLGDWRSLGPKVRK